MEIDWRLPARLRRPVHVELQRQRRRRRQREAIVQFKRRPLYPLRDGASVAKTPVPANVGVEHHTGDVYRSSRPFLVASVPPYAGSFLRGKPVLPARSLAKSTAPAKPVKPPVHVSTTPKPRIVAASKLAGERDVPYQWATAQPTRPAPVSVTPPRRRRFALPLHFSIWPFKAASVGGETTKKKVRHSDSLTSSSS